MVDELHPVRELGRGGMGVVRLVERTRGDRVERFAEKTILPTFAEPTRAKARFLQEARVAALLFHPNVVRLVDAGERDDLPWLLFEYVEGCTLAQVLAALESRGEKMPLELAAYVTAELAAGLAAAHDLRDVRGEPLGLVHRDLSPHNVMIGYDGQVKLLDFGVARLEREQGLSRTGEVHGKIAYMAPEQALGDVVSPRTDLYALGAILFECIAGRRLWHSERELEILRSFARAEPTPQLREVAPKTPEAILVLQQSLGALAPEQRPADALAVRAALLPFADPAGREHLLTLVRVLVPPGPADVPMQTAPKRRGAWVVAASLVLAAGGTFALWPTQYAARAGARVTKLAAPAPSADPAPAPTVAASEPTPRALPVASHVATRRMQPVDAAAPVVPTPSTRPPPVDPQPF